MSWRIEYALLILLSTSVDYYTGLQIDRQSDAKRKKKYLQLSLAVNLGLLCGFKYFNFFNANLSDIFEFMGMSYTVPYSELLLPIGISFYTFQSLSYTIDVYRGQIKPENHFGYFALYVSFFPQLVAGPIERAKNLLPQFKERYKFNYNTTREGLILMTWGFFKKLVIADRISLIIEPIYQNPGEYYGIEIAFAAMLFMIQVYCDFSGYSDIAIGAARIIGIRLSLNFKNSFFSKSIGELWSKWHITLMDWFKDYVYFPIGGSRGSKWFAIRNILIVFGLSGLWHGADWNVIWFGLVNGIFIVLGKLSLDFRSKLVEKSGLSKIPSLYAFSEIGTTFLLFSFTGLFFRAETLSDSFLMIGNLFQVGPRGFLDFLVKASLEFKVLLMFLFILFSTERMIGKESIESAISRQNILVRWSIYMLLLGACLNFGMTGENEFVYFQF